MSDPIDASSQFGRFFRLTVHDGKNNGNGLDLSELHCKFAVKRSDTITPNVADIVVYNIELQTALRIRNKEFTQVLLEAGYEGNFGVIFQGNIKQAILGQETATDNFINIIAGDGDRAFNFAVVNQTLASGSTQSDQINAAIKAMEAMGVSAGSITDVPVQKLPRGKVMYGPAKQFLSDTAQTTGKSWSIQDEKVVFVSNTSFLPGERVVITSKTGMVGAPQQTNEGVNVKCLLNPLLKIGRRVQLDNASIQRLKINLSVPNSAANIPAPLTADGTYYLLVVEHQGDTRGQEWWSSLICLNVDITTNPLNSVKVG